MQILLSPAKDMTPTAAVEVPFSTRPLFQAEAESHALQMSELSTENLSQLLGINSQLAALNKQRYHDFLDPEPRAAAVLSYTGMAYRHLRASEFSEADFRFAQEHLSITSFLYGLLRPLDEIKNYRLEGNVRLPDHDGATLFRFWRERLTDALIGCTLADDGILIFLASAEMKQLFDWKRVQKTLNVFAPDFHVDQGDRLKTIVVYTKMMRGAMARHLITRRIDSLDALSDFEYEGFAYRPELSTPRNGKWVLG